MVSTLQLIVWGAFFIGVYSATFWILVFIESLEREKKKYIKIVGHPTVTIAIPAYNEEKNIGRSIQSILNLKYPQENIELIVINDGSKDNTEKLVKEFISNNKNIDFKLINQINSGKGAALNKALNVSKGEFFVVLDADSQVSPNALKKMLPYFEDEDVAVVLPLLKIKNPKSLLSKIQWIEYSINFFYKSLMGLLNCVHVSPGPFSVYKKIILIEVGGFAENNLTEDLEVTLKIHNKLRYKVVQILDTEVYTSAPNSLRSFYKQRNRWYKGTMLNMFKYRWMIFNKSYGDFGMLQMPTVFLSGFLAITLLLLTLYRYVFKSLRENIYNWSKVNFDFLQLFKNFSFNFNWLNINFTNLFFLIVTLILTLFIVFYAYKLTRDKLLKYGLISFPAYLLLYSILVSGVWLTVFIDMIFKRKQKW